MQKRRIGVSAALVSGWQTPFDDFLLAEPEGDFLAKSGIVMLYGPDQIRQSICANGPNGFLCISFLGGVNRTDDGEIESIRDVEGEDWPRQVLQPTGQAPVLIRRLALKE